MSGIKDVVQMLRNPWKYDLVPALPKLPVIYKSEYAKVRIHDVPWNRDIEKEYKIMDYAKVQEGVDCFIFGIGNYGYIPFWAVNLEMAYNSIIQNMNFTFWEKGDNPLEVYYAGTLMGLFENIDQKDVFLVPKPALVRGKWLSFNVHVGS